MRSFRIAPVLLSFMVLCSSWILAQDRTRGTIAGVVEDSTGAVVPNANVTLTGPLGEISLTTDSRGAFLVPNLNPGQYAVRASLAGFRPTEIATVTNRVAEQTFVRLVLQPAEVTQTLDVTLNRFAESPIDSTKTNINTNISDALLQSTPVQRNVTAATYLAGGVRDSGGAGSANPSISGASGLENMTVVDGVNFTSPDFGSTGVFNRTHGALGTGMNFDFVKQVEVKTGGFEAQYGQALGGIVNVVTKSGGNDIHGGIYQYYAPNELEATRKQPNASLQNPGTEIRGQADYDLTGELGGSFMRDKVFWYGAVSPTYTFNDIRAPLGYDLRSRGTIVERQRSLSHSGKVTFRITPDQQVEAAYFGDPSRINPGPHHTLARDIHIDRREADSLMRWENKNMTARYDASYANRYSVSLSAGRLFNKFNETNFAEDYSIESLVPGASGIGQRFSGGIGAYDNTRNANNQFNWFNALNFDFHGKNRVEFGYSYEDILSNSFSARSGDLWTVFGGPTSVRPQDIGTPVWGATFLRQQLFPAGASVYTLSGDEFSAAPPNLTAHSRYQSGFLETTLSPSRYFTLKLGGRWEQQQLRGDPVATSLNPNRNYTFTGNWAPRLGFTIDPTGNSHSKIYFNYGYVYEKVPLQLALRSLSGAGSYLGMRFSQPAPTAANYLGGGFLSGGSIAQVWPGTKSQYQREYVAGIEHAVTDHNIMVALRFVRRDLMRVLENMSGITVEEALAGRTQTFIIGNPRARNDFFSPGGLIGGDTVPDGFVDPIRRYYAWEFSLEKRFEEVWQMVGSYRWSRLHGNYEGLFRNDNGQADPNMSTLYDFIPSAGLGDQFAAGDLPTDRRHVATFYLSHSFPEFGWNFGLGSRMESGAPITPLAAHPAYLTAGEIPVGGRGAGGRTAIITSVDGHADYTWAASDRLRVKPTFDVFNLLNQQHVRNVVQNVELAPGIPNSDFGQPIPMNTARSPMAFQRPIYARLSLRLEF